MISRRKSCYCAFCKVPRKVYSSKHLSLSEVVSFVALGIVITYAIFKSLDPRGLFIVGTILLVSELFSQMKWRSAMICRNCGFDPVVYVRNPDAAGLKIKAFMQKRSESPGHLLRAPVQMPMQAPTHKKIGENLSLKM